MQKDLGLCNGGGGDDDGRGVWGGGFLLCTSTWRREALHLLAPMLVLITGLHVLRGPQPSLIKTLIRGEEVPGKTITRWVSSNHNKDFIRGCWLPVCAISKRGVKRRLLITTAIACLIKVRLWLDLEVYTACMCALAIGFTLYRLGACTAGCRSMAMRWPGNVSQESPP